MTFRLAPSKRGIFIFLTAALSAVCGSANAYLDSESSDEFSGKTEMNGYRFKDFEGFQKKWRLVTVRFRTDSNEMRFTYANSIAWKAIERGAKEFPDGSVFGKVGYITEEDRLFTSSKVPSGSRRFQLMIRNKKMHAGTGGWGYALFDSRGKTFAEDPKTATASCVACHNIAAERGFVFSTPMDPMILIRASSKSSKPAGAKLAPFEFTYSRIDAAELAKKIPSLKDYLPNAEDVYVLEGALRDSIFQGTLDEIVPSLVEAAHLKGHPAILADRDLKRYTLVIPNQSVCKNEEKGSVVVNTKLDSKSSGSQDLAIRHLCDR